MASPTETVFHSADLRQPSDRSPSDPGSGVMLPRPSSGPDSSPSYEVIETPTRDILNNAPGTYPAAPILERVPPQRRSPLSPSPARHGPPDFLGLESSTGQIALGNSTSLPRRTSPTSEPLQPQTAQEPTLHESSGAPAVRFDLLVNHHVPPETIDYLKRFVDHHSRQASKLRSLTGELQLLRSDVDGTREHAVSLTSRVDRTMADATRYLLESEDQLASLSRAFDKPRAGMSPTTLQSMSPGPVAALTAADHVIPVLRSPRPQETVVSDDNDDLYENPTAHPAAHDASARRSMASPPRSVTDPGGSQTEVSGPTRRRPNETEDQYTSRRQAEIRLAERSRTAWSRAFPEGSSPDRPQSEMLSNPRSSHAPDARVESEDIYHEPTASPSAPRRQAPRPDVRFTEQANALHPAVSAGPMAPEFDSISRPPVDHYPRGPEQDNYSGLYVRPQGLSAYRISQTPVTGGLWNSDQYHFVVLIDKVVKLVNHKVGEPFEAPHGLKVPKIPDPSKYSGSSSHEEFMDWLGEFLNWLRGNYICGSLCDPLRVNYLGLYLSGSASDWYLTEIDNPERHYSPALKFVDCVALLHKRFVRTATANNAVILYNAIRYSSKDGVEGLYYQLDRAASKMIERPSDYAFRGRLFNCLPRWMQTLLLSRNITPEYHQLIDIRENARQIEENALRKYEGLDERSTHTQANTNTQVTRAPRAITAPKIPPAVRVTSRPQDGRARNPKAPNLKSSGARDTSTMTCYSCGAVGHISTQSVCPNYDQNSARLHAQWEVDEGSVVDVSPEEDEPIDNQDYSPTWGGSQYESDDEAVAPPEPNDSSDNVARVARMHAALGPRMCAMRILESYGSDVEQADDEGGPDDDLQSVSSLGDLPSEQPSFRAFRAIPQWLPRGPYLTSIDASNPAAVPRSGDRRIPLTVDADPRTYTGFEDRDMDYSGQPDSGMPGLELSPALSEADTDSQDRSQDSDQDSDFYADMPELETASESDSVDTDHHGSESGPLSDSDSGSSTSHSTDVSRYHDEEFRTLDNPSRPNSRVHYMDDVVHLSQGLGALQEHDYPAQRITRPSTYRVIQDLRPIPGCVYDAPSAMVADRGTAPRVVPGLVVRWEYVGRAPEEHFPFMDTVEFLTPTVWVDTQEWFLDFWNVDDLEEYNSLISQMVYCMACGGGCQPTVIQQLCRLPLGPDGSVHRTTYICTSQDATPGPAPRFAPPTIVDDLNSFQSASMMAMRVVHSSTVRRPMGDISGIIARPKQSHTTITCLIDINGHKALALFDSGSTTDSVTPEFAFASRLKQFTLPEQVTLQLGCIGSRSKICYGTVAPVDILGIRAEMYFDLINIDRYDAILGTPFLEKHGVCLDFKRKSVVIDGTPHKTFSIDEELEYLAKRGGAEKKIRGARPAPRETAPIQPRRVTAPPVITSD
ncbi:hypothetical protein HWV62_8837 [Athelia sp. TMB]|nr:hypothetical protein HWV62_8837 [Athelia sp. TMB]